MFVFSHQYNNYKDLVEALARQMNTTVKDGWLFFPPRYAKGYVRYLQLPSGMDVNIINCTITDEWLLERKPATEEYYSLRFDAITIPQSFSVTMGNEVVEKQQERVAVAYLTNSLTNWNYKATAGTSIKGVNILISRERLAKLLGLELFEHILPAYEALKSRSFTMQPLDAYYEELMNEVLNEDTDTPFPKLYLYNRVQQMIERFFNQILVKVSMADVETHFKPDDIQVVMEIEKEMTQDFNHKAPSINQLSRRAAMSATKFKNLFKSIYGKPVYEYYQHKRMQTALRLIRSGKHNVRQVGALVGYRNVGNFSTAFKKQFNASPQDYLLR